MTPATFDVLAEVGKERLHQIEDLCFDEAHDDRIGIDGFAYLIQKRSDRPGVRPRGDRHTATPLPDRSRRDGRRRRRSVRPGRRRRRHHAVHEDRRRRHAES